MGRTHINSFLVKLAFLALFLASLAEALNRSNSVAKTSCDNVYPKLSFGLNKDTQDVCESFGGCWDSSVSSCSLPQVQGYSFTQVSSSPDRLVGKLTLIGPSGAMNGDFTDLSLVVTQQTADRVRIQITPLDATTGKPVAGRWEVPQSVVPREDGHFVGKSDLRFEVINADPFELVVLRGSDVIFHLTKMTVFQDQYVQVVLGYRQDVLATYGFGESTRSSMKIQPNEPHTMWATDYWAAAEGNGKSLYGVHPFYMQVDSTGAAHGALFMNSNAMEATLFESASEGNVIGIQSTGGLIDFYVFSGPKPLDVVKQYQELTGTPYLVPYWSLGFHNCRWGYPDLQYVQDVVSNYSAAGIPLETQWVDIDYMNAFLDFTTDPVKFPLAQMQDFIATLHQNKQRFVPIVDPGIFVSSESSSDYPAFNDGIEMDVFVRDLQGNNYLGQVWPGPTYYPDFFAANASVYWEKQLQAFYNDVKYDGIWIDMNEPSNFCNLGGDYQVCQLDPGSTCPNGCCLSCQTVDPTNKLDFPPYTPHVSQNSLGGKSIAMSSVHAGNVREYDAHSLYGLMESIATHNALINVTKKRPFVLSRSTFVSSSKHTAHWTGDNAATWQDLRDAIVTINSLSIFGMSMTGADICGFAQDTTEELCARWIQAGSFSPFSRDHSAIDATPHELYRWESVTASAKNALSKRYQLLSTLYTLLYKSYRFGDLTHSALFIQFPSDIATISKGEGQFTWSDLILFTPVVTEKATSVTGYFPARKIYFPVFDNSDTYGVIDSTAAGRDVTLFTPLEYTNAHFISGSVISMQEFDSSAIPTSASVSVTSYTLVVALDSSAHQGLHAQGNLYIDDGEQVGFDDYAYVRYQFTEANTFSSRVIESVGQHSYAQAKAQVRKIRLLGVHSAAGKCQGYISADAVKGDINANFVTVSEAKLVNGEQSPELRYVDIDLSSYGIAVLSNFDIVLKCQ